jgi:hypothetical protein
MSSVRKWPFEKQAICLTHAKASSKQACDPRIASSSEISSCKLSTAHGRPTCRTPSVFGRNLQCQPVRGVEPERNAIGHTHVNFCRKRAPCCTGQQAGQEQPAWHGQPVRPSVTEPMVVRCGSIPSAQQRCAFFRQKLTLEDAIGSHACSLEASTRVTNGIPLGCPPFLTS